MKHKVIVSFTIDDKEYQEYLKDMETDISIEEYIEDEYNMMDNFEVISVDGQ